MEIEHIKKMTHTLKENIESLDFEHQGNKPFNKVTISIGVNIQHGYKINEKPIYKQADSALYTSKQNGRNSITYFE